MTEGQGIGVELVTVFMLVFVVLAITDEKREGKVLSSYHYALMFCQCRYF